MDVKDGHKQFTSRQKIGVDMTASHKLEWQMRHKIRC
jgi:hypothetical protein